MTELSFIHFHAFLEQCTQKGMHSGEVMSVYLHASSTKLLNGFVLNSVLGVFHIINGQSNLTLVCNDQS
jgi:hypothetical protein